MSIRKDTINLEIRINGENAGKTVRQLTATASQLKREMRELDPASQAFANKARELQRVNTTLSDINASTKAVGRGFDALKAVSFAGLIAGGIQLVRSLAAGTQELIGLYDIQAKAEAQLEATLVSTAGAAGRTAEELKKQASELQKVTLFGDEATLKAQATLLTFTKIQGENFDQAIESIQDMSTLLGTDLQSSAIQVGKALNDPVKGIASLSRAGIQFTEDQKAMINSLVEGGKTADAQKIILKELEVQFGGSAKAAAEAGLGPYTQFSNRLGDIKESIGLLITNGLEKLAPVLNGVLEFVEKFASNLISGEEATGRFSTGVNILAGIFKLVYFVLSNVISQVVNFYSALINVPPVAKALNFLKNLIQDIYKVAVNLPAIWAGFTEAAKQAITNVGNFITQMILSFKLLKLEAERAFTFSDSGTKIIDAQIKAINSQKQKIKDSGKSVGEAYSQAFNSAIEKAAKEKKASDIITTPPATATGGTGTGGTITNRALKGSAAPKPEDRTGKANNLTANDLISISLKARQEALKAQQKLVQDETDKELDILLTAKLKGEVTEQYYALRAIDIKKKGKEQELLVLTSFNETETNGYRDKYNELLQLNTDFADTTAKQRFDLLAGSFTNELTTLEAQYLQGLLTEEEYQNARLELKKFYIEQELALLQANGLSDTETFRNKELEKLKIEKEISDQRIAVSKREAELKKEASAGYYNAFSAFIDLAVAASNRETGERKKNANLIKTFEKARILTQLYGEISGYFTQYAKVPGGQIIAGLLSVAAGGRAALNIAKVNSQKFALGGLLNGPSHTHGGIPITMGGVQAAEAEGGEAFINKRSTAAFRPILSAINSFNGWGRKFETGGVLPGLSISPSAITAQAPTSSLQSSTLERKFEALIDLLGQGLDVRAAVVYTDIEAKSNTINSLRAATRT
jgi:hypothetical protein